MPRLRAIDEHVAAMRQLNGRLVDPPRGAWCPIHDTQRTPCTACAGDHRAGEHHSLPPLPSCRHCTTARTTPLPTVDVPALAARNDA
ncbi:hypothetical protein ACQP60_04310 [Isoptericola variabilis]|uniref:hypothetical protein n=1 Tax=Isoptericola variabilis TaxID=139208 RepID=UPI003D238A33